jgi:hypothetical protein
MNLWHSFLEHWHCGVWNWGPTHPNFIYGYKHKYFEQRWVDGGRCYCRMDCAMGTLSSGLVVLWLVIQKQSDGALERGFGWTWRSFGCWATESGVCTVTSRISWYSFQQRNGYTDTSRLYSAWGRAVPVFCKCFRPRWLLRCVSQERPFTADRNLVPNHSVPFPAAKTLQVLRPRILWIILG